MSERFADALALAQRGDFAGAERLLIALRVREPNNADVAHLLGNILHAKGAVEAAIAQFAIAQELAPNDPVIAFNRAAALAGAQRHGEAVDAFAQAVALNPKDSEALFARGASLATLQRYDEALAAYDAAYAAGLTDRPQLYANRGAALAALKRHAEAVAALDRALAANPNDASALFNRGAALMELQRPADALRDLDRLLAIKPNHQQGRAVRGVVLALLGRFDEGIALIDAAIAVDPARVELQERRGFALTIANRGDEALEAYARVLAVAPGNVAALYGAADALLAKGDFAAGLDYYEHRVAKQALQSPLPVWTGAEPLAGKSILVQGEQGFGDLFQFCRFIPMLAAQGARVLLQERPQTEALMRSLAGVAQFVRRGETPPPTDFRIPLCSLMRAFNVRLDTIPANVPYLSAEPARVAQWRARLGPSQIKRVGIAWTGGVSQALQRARPLDHAALERILSGADAQFVSLQMDDAVEADLLRAHGALSFGDATADFAELAALIETLDVVVSIDTGVAHLAGALGKPVHILLPWFADWRWLRARSDTPWYPTARLYRQSSFGDWGPVIDDVCAALQ